MSNEAFPTHAYWRQLTDGAWPFKPATQFMFRHGETPSEANANMAVDGSSTPVSFRRVCPEGQVIAATRALILVQDGGTWRESYFAGLGSALSNGLRFRHYKADGTYFTLTCVIPVVSLATMRSHCYDVTFGTVGTGDSSMEARWTFAHMGAPVLLEAGDYLECLVQDDLTGLTLMYVKIDATILSGDNYVTP